MTRAVTDGNGVPRHLAGYRPGLKLPADRDRRFAVNHAAVPQLPKAAFSQLVHLLPTYDQLGIGSCTANAALYDFRHVLAHRLVELGLDITPQTLFAPSRLFLYKKTRQIEGTPLDEDAGATVQNTNRALEVYGVAAEALDPYVDDGQAFKRDPSEAEALSALEHQTLLSYRPQSILDQKFCIAQGFGVQFGFTCFESLMSADAARTGRIPWPEPGEKEVGGHAMYKVGYDDDLIVNGERGAWILLQSWGEWGAELGGQKRYGIMPYRYDQERLAGDYRTQRLVEDPR